MFDVSYSPDTTIERWAPGRPFPPNTCRPHAGEFRRLDTWLAGQRFDDATLAVHLGALCDAGRSPAAIADVAATFRARLAGQTAPFGLVNLAAVLGPARVRDRAAAASSPSGSPACRATR